MVRRFLDQTIKDRIKIAQGAVVKRKGDGKHRSRETSAHTENETSQLAACTSKESAIIVLLVIVGIILSVIHNEDKSSQGRKHKKDTKPDQATTALVQNIEQLGQNLHVNPRMDRRT